MSVQVELNFTEAKLTREQSDKTIELKGAATIFKDGTKVKLKFYCHNFNDVVWNDIQQPGTILRSEDFFVFSGVDTTGLEWRSSKLHLSKSQSPRKFGEVISVDIKTLKSGTVPERFGWLTCRYEKVLNLSYNDEGLFHVKGKDYQLFFQNLGDSTQLVVNVPSGNNEDYFSYILQGASIALGYNLLNYYIYEIEISYTCNHSRQYGFGKRLSHPIDVTSHGEEALVNFINCYIEFNRNVENNAANLIEFHQWTLMQESLMLGVDSRSLINTVCIEAILNRRFLPIISDFTKEQEEIDEKLKEVEDQKAHLSEYNYLALVAALKHRKKKSPNAILKTLSGGAITNGQIRKWYKVRNKAAHGNLLGWHTGDQHKSVELYFSNLHLFYCLVFYAVGYTGPYLNMGVMPFKHDNFTEHFNHETGCREIDK